MVQLWKHQHNVLLRCHKEVLEARISIVWRKVHTLWVGFKNTSSADESYRSEKDVFSPVVPDLNVVRKSVPYDIPATDENTRNQVPS